MVTPLSSISPTLASGAAIPGIDVSILVYLLGEVVTPLDPISRKRDLLMDGLRDWTRADGWFREVHSDGQQDCRIHLGSGRATDEMTQAAQLREARESRRLLEAARPHAEGGYVRLGLFRKPGAAPFTDRECKVSIIVFDEVDWLYADPETVPLSHAMASLSPRHQSIVELLQHGWDRKRVASELGISANTLAWHLKEVYRRLGVNNHASLLRVCAASGLNPS